ncbi:MAG: biopolymer transporter ExbD [Elusimicrobiota bacterium]|jgi:biopolymer transport protein ExbD
MSRYPLAQLAASGSEAEPMTEVNIIPVIDISLVLLVILFVTAPLLSYPNTPIELPRAAQKSSTENTLAVTCAQDERLAVASQETDWEGLQAALSAELVRDPDRTVLLRVDKRVPYRSVQRLLLACKRAGARRISVAADPIR